MGTPNPSELPYDSRSLPAFAAAVARLPQTEVDGGIVLVGDCVRCGHQMDAFVPTVPQTGTLVARPRGQSAKPGPEYHEQAVRCNCEMPHAGRPEGVEGCGAMGTIRFPS